MFSLGVTEIFILAVIFAPLILVFFLIKKDISLLGFGFREKFWLILSLIISWPATLITWLVLRPYLRKVSSTEEAN